jgi:hypothetical protein
MPNSAVDKALAGAKAELAKANKKFPDLATASYSLARQARTPSAAVKNPAVDYNPIHTVRAVEDVFRHPEGGSTAQGLKAIKDNVAQVSKAIQQ